MGTRISKVEDIQRLNLKNTLEARAVMLNMPGQANELRQQYIEALDKRIAELRNPSSRRNSN